MTDVVQLAEACAARAAERAAAYDRDADFPTDDIDDLRSAGLLGLLVPVDLGGHGAGFVEYVRVAQALASGSGATALVFNMHASVTGALATVPLDLARDLGAPDAFFAERERVLREAAAGALYGVAITEREAGSRLSALRTTYERQGDRYRIRGHKSVVTGAGRCDSYLVAARAADAPPPEVAGADGRISYFLVPNGAGLTVEQTWDPLGMRATASNGLALDVEVADGALVGGVEGLAVLLAYALPQWLVASYAAVYVGVARAAVTAAVEHIGARTVVGVPGGLGDVASVRARLGRADAQVEAARLVLEHAAALVDAAPGDPETNSTVYRAKLLAGDAAGDVTASMAEACGLAALRRGAELERLVRDARSGALMPPSSDVCADVLGTALLGRDPVTGTTVRPW